jgi:hypothetical protein
MNTTSEQQDTFEPANLSHYFHAIDDVHRGANVVLCPRVSRLGQKASGNCADQAQRLRSVADERGFNVVDVFPHVGHGSDFSWLIPAVAKAKACGAKLLAESASRFIRSEKYDPVKAPEAQPSKQQMDSLLAIADGVELVTVVNPAATPAEERAYQSRRGNEAKKNWGGRPPSKSDYLRRRRAKLKPIVKKLREEGASLGEIVRQKNVPKSTVRDWLKSG